MNFNFEDLEKNLLSISKIEFVFEDERLIFSGNFYKTVFYKIYISKNIQSRISGNNLSKLLELRINGELTSSTYNSFLLPNKKIKNAIDDNFINKRLNNYLNFVLCFGWKSNSLIFDGELTYSSFFNLHYLNFSNFIDFHKNKIKSYLIERKNQKIDILDLFEYEGNYKFETFIYFLFCKGIDIKKIQFKENKKQYYSIGNFKGPNEFLSKLDKTKIELLINKYNLLDILFDYEHYSIENELNVNYSNNMENRFFYIIKKISNRKKGIFDLLKVKTIVDFEKIGNYNEFKKKIRNILEKYEKPLTFIYSLIIGENLSLILDEKGKIHSSAFDSGKNYKNMFYIFLFEFLLENKFTYEEIKNFQEIISKKEKEIGIHDTFFHFNNKKLIEFLLNFKKHNPNQDFSFYFITELLINEMKIFENQYNWIEKDKEFKIKGNEKFYEYFLEKQLFDYEKIKKEISIIKNQNKKNLNQLLKNAKIEKNKKIIKKLEKEENQFNKFNLDYFKFLLELYNNKYSFNLKDYLHGKHHKNIKENISYFQFCYKHNGQYLNLKNAIKLLMGIRSKKIIGIGKNPGVIYKKYKNVKDENPKHCIKIIKEHGLEVGELIKYEVKIENPTNANYILAGNYSKCCMNYGSDKMIDYINQKGFSIINLYENGEVIGNSLIHFAWVNGKKSLILDNIEINKNRLKNKQIGKIYKNGILLIFENLSNHYNLEQIIIGEGNDLKIIGSEKIEIQKYFSIGNYITAGNKNYFRLRKEEKEEKVYSFKGFQNIFYSDLRKSGNHLFTKNTKFFANIKQKNRQLDNYLL